MSKPEPEPPHDLAKLPWFRLPLKLRQRYWRETDYGKLPPRAELRQELEAAANEDARSGSA